MTSIRPRNLSRITAALLAISLASIFPVALLAAEPTTLDTAEQSAATALVQANRVLVIAHRGDSHAAPENTLAAFTSAVTAGSDLVELDYHHSADAQPIVIHDGTLDRTTDAVKVWGGNKVSVSSKSLDLLKQLDAGTWFKAQFAGQRLPTLSEALDVIQAGSTTLIERKGGDAATCVSLLKEKNLTHQVVVQAFDWNYLAACHRLEPTLVLAALGRGKIDDEVLDRVQAIGASIVAWMHPLVDPAAINAIHDRGLRAWCWTLDDTARAEALISAGIDAIITNEPAKMRSLVDRLVADGEAETGTQAGGK